MEPFGAFFGTKCTPYLEARQKARSGVKGLIREYMSRLKFVFTLNLNGDDKVSTINT